MKTYYTFTSQLGILVLVQKDYFMNVELQQGNRTVSTNGGKK